MSTNTMMKAVRYHGPDTPFTFEDVAKPEAGAGEVLVEVKAAALCHTELHFADGTLNLGVLFIAAQTCIDCQISSLCSRVRSPSWRRSSP